MLRFFKRQAERKSAAFTSDKPLRISPQARVSLTEQGGVFLHGGTGAVFTINCTGASIWRGLHDTGDVAAIARRISRETGVTEDVVLRDTREFVSELISQGFLTN